MPSLSIELSERFTIRPPASEDIPAIIELMMALDLKHYGVADHYSPEDILEGWKHLDLTRDAWAFIAPDGRLAAYGDVSDEGSGRLRADGYVHAD